MVWCEGQQSMINIKNVLDCLMGLNKHSGKRTDTLCFMENTWEECWSREDRVTAYHGILMFQFHHSDYTATITIKHHLELRLMNETEVKLTLTLAFCGVIWTGTEDTSRSLVGPAASAACGAAWE